MLFRIATALGLLAFATAAHADIRATYSDGSVVEINDDGASRGNLVSDGHWMMQVDGRDYLVVDDGGTPRVLDPAIVEQVATTYTPELFLFMINEMPPLTPHQSGQVTIERRTATGYRIDDEQAITFAISADPELATLGETIAQQFRTWTFMQGPMGRLSAPLSDMFESGAAVRVGNADLIRVEEVEIDDTQFALPSEPLDWFATEEVMLRLGLIKVG